MQHWLELLRSFPAAAICLALLSFGSGMLDKGDVVPADLRVSMAYAGASMMLAGGVGLIVILPHTIYRLFVSKTAPT